MIHGYQVVPKLGDPPKPNLVDTPLNMVSYNGNYTTCLEYVTEFGSDIFEYNTVSNSTHVFQPNVFDELLFVGKDKYAIPFKGYGMIKGRMFEKVDTSLYNAITHLDLYDANTEFKYGKFPVIEGEFNIPNVAQNEYDIIVRDPTDKYTGKVVKFVVDKDDISLIKPNIIVSNPATLIKTLTPVFKQRVEISGCVSGELISFNITNKPSWLNVSKVTDTEYLISGTIPSNLLDTVITLEYNVYDYRPGNVVESYTTSREYNLTQVGQFNLFNTLDNVTVNGNARLTKYNNMDGISVNGVANSIEIPNSTVPILNNTYTIMFAFTMNDIDYVGTNNMFVSNFISRTSTSSTNTFFIGTSDANSDNRIRLRFRIATESILTETILVPKETYFIKITVNEGQISVWVNGRIIHSAKTKELFQTDNRTVVFGGAYWGDRTSNITIHEYNFIPNYADVVNDVSFRCSPNKMINLFNSDVTLLYKFSQFGLSNRGKLEDYAKLMCSVGNYTSYLLNNALLERRVLSINKLDQYTLSVEFTPKQANYTQTLLSIGKIKIQLSGINLNIVDLNDTILYSMGVVFDTSMVTTVIVDKQVGQLFINGNLINQFNIISDVCITPCESVDVTIGCKNYNDWLSKSNLSNSPITCAMVRDKIASIGDHIPTWYRPITSNANFGNRLYTTQNAIEGSTATPAIYANDTVYEPILKTDGVTVDEEGSYVFTTGTDRLAFYIPEIADEVSNVDMTFDFYWSGLRTGNSSTDSILYILNTLDQTTIPSTISRNILTIRCDGTGKNPKLRVHLENLIGVTSSTSQLLQVGWNKIRCFKQSRYHFGFYLNGVLVYDATHSSSYTSSFGVGGYVNFGYNNITKVGLVGCKIKNLNISMSGVLTIK